MEEITVLVGGDILSVPAVLAISSSQMRWLEQPSFSGVSPDLDQLAIKAANIYFKKPPIPYYATVRCKFHVQCRHFFWRHIKLTGIMRKYQITYALWYWLVFGKKRIS